MVSSIRFNQERKRDRNQPTFGGTPAAGAGAGSPDGFASKADVAAGYSNKNEKKSAKEQDAEEASQQQPMVGQQRRRGMGMAAAGVVVAAAEQERRMPENARRQTSTNTKGVFQLDKKNEERPNQECPHRESARDAAQPPCVGA